jgi:hypothetical protein
VRRGPMKYLTGLILVALLAASCGGKAKVSGSPSNNTSICAYKNGHTYVQLAATPKSLRSAACSDFNATFGGRQIPAVGRMGTGHVYCSWEKDTSSSRIVFGIFADSGAAGRAYCRAFRPAPGYKRDV